MAHKEHSKNVNGWGHIVLKIKDKKTSLEDCRSVSVYYLVVEIDVGRHKDYKEVVNYSTDKKEILKDFRSRKKGFEETDYSFEDFMELKNKYE